jgi:uncharacterized protein YbjT (DUF2867 family)
MILVAGATGNVGSSLVRELLARGERPRAFVRKLEKGREVLGEGVEFAEGDFERPETIDAAMDGVDRLFVLTPSTPRLREHERNLLGAAKRAGVRVVKLSALTAGKQSPMETIRAHGEAEQDLKRSGLPHTILQCSFYMQNFFAMINGGVIATAAGAGRVSMVDARDVGAAAAAVLTETGHDGKTYVLTGREALTFDEAAQTLAEATGTDIQHVRVTQDDIRNALRQMTGDEWLGNLLAALSAVMADDQLATVTDSLQELAGRAPRSLADFARDHAGVLAGAAPAVA